MVSDISTPVPFEPESVPLFRVMLGAVLLCSVIVPIAAYEFVATNSNNTL
jgi:hypothetical protein